MLATEFPKRNISSNIDILGEGELRNDEVQDANGILLLLWFLLSLFCIAAEVFSCSTVFSSSLLL
jgi:hypothetical protein